jgi:hypothetical protein
MCQTRAVVHCTVFGSVLLSRCDIVTVRMGSSAVMARARLAFNGPPCSMGRGLSTWFDCAQEFGSRGADLAPFGWPSFYAELHLACWILCTDRSLDCRLELVSVLAYSASLVSQAASGVRTQDSGLRLALLQHCSRLATSMGWASARCPGNSWSYGSIFRIFLRRLLIRGVFEPLNGI